MNKDSINYGERWVKLLSARRFSASKGETDNSSVPQTLNEGKCAGSELPCFTGDSSLGAGASSRSPFEVDYQRVVFASPFRRLAKKTQVHPFAEIDYIHNRLTHSLEVASVCHSLGKKVVQFLSSRGAIDASRFEDVCWILQAAGLAHDIGNPAYGHSGEEAIRAWASSGKMQRDATLKDFRLFDGNAQAFRLLSRDDLRSSVYFRFSAASLGALVKHPFVASDFNESPASAKLAAFSTEEALFKRIWQELGLVRPDGSFMRHPLSYLTEAADDICYRILDFEDAVTMGIFSAREISELFRGLINEKSRGKSEGRPLQWLRGTAIHDLIEAIACQFEVHYDEIMTGNFKGELKDYLEGSMAESFHKIKERYPVLFSDSRKVIAEIGSYARFSLVFDRYYVFLDLIPSEIDRAAPEYASLPALCKLLVQLAWDEAFYNENRRRGRLWWAHAVLDFVSGMTDDYLDMLGKKLG